MLRSSSQQQSNRPGMRIDAQLHYNRPISEFKGDSVVIGCSQNHTFVGHVDRPHQDPKAFYSIDANPKNNADFVFNINDPLPQEFKNRFHFTFLECMPISTYGLALESSESDDLEIKSDFKPHPGFQNILDMTHHDGMILIISVPRYKHARISLYQHGIKYIELANGKAIIFSKNQKLTLPETLEKAAALSLAAYATINNAVYLNGDENCNILRFCNIAYKDLPSFALKSFESESQASLQSSSTLLGDLLNKAAESKDITEENCKIIKINLVDFITTTKVNEKILELFDMLTNPETWVPLPTNTWDEIISLMKAQLLMIALKNSAVNFDPSAICRHEPASKTLEKLSILKDNKIINTDSTKLSKTYCTLFSTSKTKAREQLDKILSCEDENKKNILIEEAFDLTCSVIQQAIRQIPSLSQAL